MKMNPRQRRLKTKYGPWAVVTGASSGIGCALAKYLSRSGMNLVLVSRSVNALDQLAAELRKCDGVECRVLAIDLSDETGIEPLDLVTKDLDVGLVVLSAGFGTSGSFLDNPLEEELEMLQVNCGSLMALSWYFGRRFASQGRGGIVLLSSIVSFQGNPWASHYAATKAYVQTLAEGLRVELREKSVDVLSVAPGPTKTGFATRAGMKMGLALDPNKIASEIMNRLGRTTTVLPGFLSKLLVYSLAPLPRWARIRVMGGVMKGMAEGKQSGRPRVS